MKMCSKCNISKAVSNFSNRKNSIDGLAYTCKECANTASKQHYIENKSDYVYRAIQQSADKRVQFLNWKKTLKCLECDENTPCCLDFHHLDITTKEACVAEILTRSLTRVCVELDKCVCLCANCHRKAHMYNKTYTPTKLGQNLRDFIRLYT